jgi:nicotinate-nucleotide adenylyltransferase
MSAGPVIGVLGGTFDPVHLGHLAMARSALQILGLQRLLLLPTAIPPHKSVPGLTSAAHREAMLRLATAGEPGLKVETLELRTGHVCYTIDTLRRLRRGPPACRPLFVMGMDSLLEIETWREHEQLVREFDLAVIDRNGEGLEQARSRLPADLVERLVRVAAPGADTPLPEPGNGGRIYHLPLEEVPVSSTKIRARAAAGENLDGLVPPAVARYIRDNGLYRREERPLTKQLPAEITRCVEAALDKKAEDLVVLDLRGLSDVTDFFVVCHGTSDRHVLAITESIQDSLREDAGLRPSHVEGDRRAEWILLDYIDLVVHVFIAEKREFYRLESLWGDAPRHEFSAEMPDSGA